MQDPILHTPLHVSLIDPENIIDARSVHIAECWSATDLNRAEGEKVASEIVRRVNLHDELVEALRLLREGCRHVHAGVSIEDELQLADAVLAKLEI